MQADYRVDSIYVDKETGEIFAKCYDNVYGEKFEKYLGNPEEYQSSINASIMLEDSNFSMTDKLRNEIISTFGLEDLGHEMTFATDDYDDEIYAGNANGIVTEEELDAQYNVGESFNLREALNRIDVMTSNKFDLRNLYESVELSEEDKKQLATLIYDQEDPSVIYDTLNGKFLESIGMNEEDENKSPIIHKKSDGSYMVASEDGKTFTAFNKNDECVGNISANNEQEAKNKFNSNKFDGSLTESSDITWHDVYKQFLDIVDSTYTGGNEEEIAKAVEELYRQHDGEPAWDAAWLRWLDHTLEPGDEGFEEADALYRSERERINNRRPNEAQESDLEIDLRNSTNNFTNLKGSIKYESSADAAASAEVLKKHYSTVRNEEDSTGYYVIYRGKLEESLSSTKTFAQEINSLRNEKGQVMADKWYASKWPDDEVGIEQLQGITLDDALKDRKILDHCDTQVRERVYAQLDRYIPLSKESPMHKEENESKSIKESVSSGKYSLNFGHWRTGNGKSFNSEKELIEFLEDNYVENGTIVTQSQNVTDQFSKYFQYPPKGAHVSREFFDRGYELIVNEKEGLNEDISETPIEDIEAFITEAKGDSLTHSPLSMAGPIPYAVKLLYQMDKFVMDVYDNEGWLMNGIPDGEFEETTADEAMQNYHEHAWLIEDEDSPDGVNWDDFNDFIDTFSSVTKSKNYDQKERNEIIDEADTFVREYAKYKD